MKLLVPLVIISLAVCVRAEEPATDLKFELKKLELAQERLKSNTELLNSREVNTATEQLRTAKKALEDWMESWATAHPNGKGAVTDVEAMMYKHLRTNVEDAQEAVRQAGKHPVP